VWTDVEIGGAGGRLGQVAGTGPVGAIPMARLPSGAVPARYCKTGEGAGGSFDQAGAQKNLTPGFPGMERKVAFHVSKSDAAEGRWTVLPFEASPIGELRDTEYVGLRGVQLNATSLHPLDAGRQTGSRLPATATS
jgi:hypothetical protein